MPRKTNLRTKFAHLAVTHLEVPSGLHPKARAGLELALALHDAAPDECKDQAAHFFNVVRKIALKDAAEKNERAKWSWGWKGCDIATHDGTVLATFPAGRDQPYLRPSTLLALMAEHDREDLVVILHPMQADAVPA